MGTGLMRWLVGAERERCSPRPSIRNAPKILINWTGKGKKNLKKLVSGGWMAYVSAKTLSLSLSDATSFSHDGIF